MVRLGLNHDSESFRLIPIQLPLFGTDTDGSSRKQKYIIGRRNWCSIDWDRANGNLLFTLQVEKEKGGGVTVP